MSQLGDIKHDFTPNLVFFLFLLDRTGMLHQCGGKKFITVRARHRQSCPDLSYPVVQFLVIILIFLNPSHHFTPYTTDTHKKRDGPKLLKGVS
jgi:hypothetical protein